MSHPMVKDQVLVSSWGYEQTNVQFYQVVAVTPKTVKVRELNKNREYSSDMSGTCTPVLNDFVNDKELRRTVDTGYDADGFIKITDYQYARPWNKKPVNFSSYG